MNFCERLRFLREERGYTQQNLAEILHVSKNSISHYELGISMPSVDIIVQIADIFGVSLDYMLCRSDCNISYDKITKPYCKGTSTEKVIETILALDAPHRTDLLKLLYYINFENSVTIKQK